MVALDIANVVGLVGPGGARRGARCALRFGAFQRIVPDLLSGSFFLITEKQ